MIHSGHLRASFLPEGSKGVRPSVHGLNVNVLIDQKSVMEFTKSRNDTNAY